MVPAAYGDSSVIGTVLTPCPGKLHSIIVHSGYKIIGQHKQLILQLT